VDNIITLISDLCESYFVRISCKARYLLCVYIKSNTRKHGGKDRLAKC